MLLTPENQLAYLGFQLVPPRLCLRSYVRSYWYFRRELPLAAYHEEYMHPRGGFGIVFNFGDCLTVDAGAVNAPIFLDGANTVSRKLGFQGHIELMGVQFQEGGAFPFLGIPLHELQNETHLLSALDKSDLVELHERLYEAKTLSMRINFLETWLLRQLSLGKEQHALIPVSLSALREGAGNLRMSELAEQWSVSQRQLERLYQREVGMSPKQYAQVLRIETARLSLKGMREETTARLAVELGFYDQAHFIREFRAVVGMTPYAYMKRRHKRIEETETD
jgi:AraC-like DNA-binding protein